MARKKKEVAVEGVSNEEREMLVGQGAQGVPVQTAQVQEMQQPQFDMRAYNMQQIQQNMPSQVSQQQIPQQMPQQLPQTNMPYGFPQGVQAQNVPAQNVQAQGVQAQGVPMQGMNMFPQAPVYQPQQTAPTYAPIPMLNGAKQYFAVLQGMGGMPQLYTFDTNVNSWRTTGIQEMQQLVAGCGVPNNMINYLMSTFGGRF